MVGACKNLHASEAPRQALAAHQKLISLRAGPTAQRAGIGQPRGILRSEVRPVPNPALLAQTVSQACCRQRRDVVTIRRRPTRQDGERLAAQPAQPAPYPDQSCCRRAPDLRRCPCPMIVCPLTQRAPRGNWRKSIRVTPGPVLSPASGSAIKRITAGVKACRWTSLPGLVRRPAFTLLVSSMSNEKRILPSVA